MLFDLRSRGRRRTVQVIYIGLAVLIGAGLILFGVGTGSGGGGLFGAFTGSNQHSGANGNAVTSQVKSAVARTKKEPHSAAAWANLINARLSAANSIGYDTTSSTYTKAGKQQLTLLTQAYTRYTSLTKTPSTNTATLAAKAYTQLGNWKTASATYQAVLGGQTGDNRIHTLECVALTSYAAKDDRVAQLAQARVLTLLPTKSVRKQVKTELEQAKTSTTVVTESC
ncbi:MAG TPA: hypothetical protein VMF07_00010 [Solirubrobacteraceae bacterium]|nr:hypothetical protein [Solirubrobacteraceae bacterium]